MNQFFLELRYFAAFWRESRKGTGGVKNMQCFDLGRVCAWIYDASFSGVCRPKFTKLGTRVEQPCALKKFILELQYSAAFGRESKGDRKYAEFRHFLAHRVV